MTPSAPSLRERGANAPAIGGDVLPARLPKLLMLILALLALPACTTQSFRTDVRGYTESYAQVSDQQMLYNLARLNNSLPAYFMTIGPISSSYTFQATDQATAGATGGLSRTSANTNTFYAPGVTGLLTPLVNTFTRAVTRGVNFGNNVGGSVEASPTFNYIPLNGDQAAKEFLSQISPELFEHFCQQGWPIDQLLRVLVDRIEVRLPSGDTAIMTNSPTRGSPQSYVLFLRVCGELRTLQREGKLVIRNKKEVQYFGDQMFSNPAPKDLISANSEGYKWYKVSENAWMIGKEVSTPVFTVLARDAGEVDDSTIAGSKSEANLRQLLQNGISISSNVPNTDDSTTKQAYIVLRSYSTALSSVATESNTFYDIVNRFPPSSHTGVPIDECRPVIELLWDKSKVPDELRWDQLRTPVLAFSFEGKMYKVTDPVFKSGDEATGHWMDKLALATWNRDTFRLLVELQSEIGVDTSKFQNQIIQFKQQ